MRTESEARPLARQLLREIGVEETEEQIQVVTKRLWAIDQDARHEERCLREREQSDMRQAFGLG